MLCTLVVVLYTPEGVLDTPEGVVDTRERVLDYFTEMYVWFRGGLVFEAYRLLYHSTLGLRAF
jgi:hypothetical protein